MDMEISTHQDGGAPGEYDPAKPIKYRIGIEISFDAASSEEGARRLSDLGRALREIGDVQAESEVAIRINGRPFVLKAGVVVPLRAGDSG
jgi:hypothetical protein